MKKLSMIFNQLTVARLLNKLNIKSSDIHSRELFRGSSIAFVYKVLGMSVGYIFTLLVTRNLGAEVMGIFALSITILTVFSVAGRFGMDTALLKFVAEYNSGNRMGLVKEIYIKSIKILVPYSLFLSVVLYFISPWVSDFFFQKGYLTGYIRIFSIGILPMVLISIHAESLRGIRKIASYSFLQDIAIYLFATIIFVITMFFIKDSYVPFIAFSLSLVFVSVLSLVMWLKSSELYSVTYKNSIKTTDILKVSLPMLLSSSSFLIMGWTDTIMLGIFRTEREVGVYNVAMKVAALTSITLYAINRIAAPKFAESYAKGDTTGFEAIVRQSTRLIFWTSLPILVIFFVFPSFILGIFGEEFKAGEYALLLLTIGYFINAISGSVGYILQMTGKQKVFQNIMIVAVIINIGLNIFLIPEYGITGAAFAHLFSLAFWNISSVIYIKAAFNVTTIYFPGIRNYEGKI